MIEKECNCGMCQKRRLNNNSVNNPNLEIMKICNNCNNFFRGECKYLHIKIYNPENFYCSKWMKK